MKILIKNAHIVNENSSFRGNLLTEGEFIKKITTKSVNEKADQIIDATGQYLIPGVIDDQVHFREPGLTHKAEIATESRAAVAGGVTSFMEMPNTQPQTTSIDALNQKFNLASKVSPANYSFYFGATNSNSDELQKLDSTKVCGVKVFMGSSTGNMLVDNNTTLEKIFTESPVLIATHCEDEYTVKRNLEKAKEQYRDQIPFDHHPIIRSAEACYLSSSKAVELAVKTGARLHILHLSTAKEMSLFSDVPVCDKTITAEVCVHHLWFDNRDYAKKGSFIKWNPAIKSPDDRIALLKALKNGRIDVVATDHAPHTREEKMHSYTKTPSGGPLVQHGLIAMMELVKSKHLSLEMLVEKMSHNPARLFRINKRGFIKEGFYADLVLINPKDAWQVSKDNIRYKCGWSPFEGDIFHSKVTHTIVNGTIVYEKNQLTEALPGQPLTFNRNRNNSSPCKE